MNKSMKKILVTSASLLMVASVGAGISQSASSVHASRYPVNVAYGTGFGRYIPWHHLHYITVNHRGHGVGSAGSAERPSWFRKNGHIFHMDDQADITSLDGIRNPSKAQLRRALRSHHYRRHVAKHHRKYYKRTRRHSKKFRHSHKLNRKHKAEHNRR